MVMDSLNTHGIGSPYQAFEPEVARRLVHPLEIQYTPNQNQGSWTL